MGDFVIRPVDIFDIIRRHKKTMSLSFICVFTLVMALYVVVPRSYRSEAVVHIGVSYFQNPLIGDLISQTHDPGELRAEREKIIKSALGVEFARKMGEKHDLFKTEANDRARAVEVENFLKNLDISPLTATQFTLKYRGRNPEVVDDIIHSAISSIRETMYANRMRMLEEFYAVLQEEITHAGGSTPKRTMTMEDAQVAGASRIAAERTQIASQIQVLEKRLNDMTRSYSENHPSVQAVKTEIAELRMVENGGALSARLTRRKLFGGKGNNSSTSNTNIREDLQKQEHLLSISLEMEKKDPTMASYVTVVKEPIFPKSPVFPKIRLFILTALIAGIMAATIAVAMAEFWQRAEVSPERVSESLGAELFGMVTLPEAARQ